MDRRGMAALKRLTSTQRAAVAAGKGPITSPDPFSAAAAARCVVRASAVILASAAQLFGEPSEPKQDARRVLPILTSLPTSRELIFEILCHWWQAWHYSQWLYSL